MFKNYKYFDVRGCNQIEISIRKCFIDTKIIEKLIKYREKLSSINNENI